MPDSSSSTRKCRNRFFLFNMAIGLLVTCVALYLVISGEYSSLAERKQMEGYLNLASLLGMLYAVGAWFAYVIFSPNCKSQAPSSELL